MNKIYQFKLGEILCETDAVVKDNYKVISTLPVGFYFGDGRLEIEILPTDIIYGLGQNTGGLNKRGKIYTSFCSDTVMHLEETLSLYGAHNFLLISGKNPLGLFFDTPSKITFDVGFTEENKIIVTMENWNGNLYLLSADTPLAIIKNFRELIGESYIPPLFAFGYQQSRWGYKNEADILAVRDGYNKYDIPLDTIYLDIDYMERFKDFTVSKEAFPNFKDLIAALKREHLRLIPIIDAGVKIEKGYHAYEEGLKNNYFCQTVDGKPFVAAVWPGLVHFPDFMQPKARAWFGALYQPFFDLGIEGFWNDMNEPAIFYTPKCLKEAIDSVKNAKDYLDLNVYEFWELLNKFEKLANNPLDYQDIYHQVGNKLLNHYQIHNLYGYNMLRSVAEHLANNTKNRKLLIARASAIGMHRYGGIWTGDNRSWWQHLELNIKMMPNLNMVGFLYTGADTGGFGADANRELLCRWLAFSIFTPLFRNHSALSTRNQELYNFSNPEAFKNIIRLRYALIPYLYSEYLKAVKNNSLLFTPLALKYPDDENCLDIEDELLVGDSIMIAPVYKPNSKGRYVYLPEDMLLVRFKAEDDYKIEGLAKGHHYFKVDLLEVLVFILPNKILPLTKSSLRTDELNLKELTLIANPHNEANYIYYLDDGLSNDSKLEKITLKTKEIISKVQL